MKKPIQHFRRKRKYKRIPYEKRQELIALVFRQGLKIKEAASILKINYAAAKTVIVYHREQKLMKNQQYVCEKRTPYKLIAQLCSSDTLQSQRKIFYTLIVKHSEEIISQREYEIKIN